MASTGTRDEDKRIQSRVTEAAIRIAVLALLVYLCARVLRPFINPMIGGVVIAIALQAPYEKLARRLGGKRRLASAVLVVLVLLVLLVPAVLLGASVVDTAKALSEGFDSRQIAVPPPPDTVAGWPVVGERLYDTWLAASSNLESVLVKAAPHLNDVGLALIGAMGDLGFGLFMFVVAIIIGGALLPGRERSIAMTRQVATIVAGERGPALADLVAASVQSVIRGVIGVAIIQSVLAGIGMLFVGVPGAGLWALLVLLLAVMQLPPLLVLGPVVLYVFAAHSTIAAVLFAIYALLVGASDNVLKPLLMGRGSTTPMLVLFMGSLGGFLAGGLLGLFVGAVVLSIGYTVFMAWVDESEAKTEDAEARPGNT